MKFVVRYQVAGTPVFGRWDGAHWTACGIDSASYFDNRLQAIALAGRLEASHKPEVLEYEPGNPMFDPIPPRLPGVAETHQPPEASGGSDGGPV